MYKIAVMGAYDSIYGFASLGLDIHPVSDIREGEETLRRLATGEYAVIYITEELAAQIPHEIARYRFWRSPGKVMGQNMRYRSIGNHYTKERKHD